MTRPAPPKPFNFTTLARPSCHQSLQTADDFTEQSSSQSNFGNKSALLLSLAAFATFYHYKQSSPYTSADNDASASEDNSERHLNEQEKLEMRKKRQAQQQQSQKQQETRHPDPIEIPRLLMEREARKKQEYASRTKVDVQDILNDSEARQIKVSNHEQDALLKADPSRGDLLTAEHYLEGDDSDLIDEDEDEFDGASDETLGDLVKDPFSKKRQNLMTPQEYRVVTIGDEHVIKEGQMVQVAISDPFDSTKFYPTDKILVLKHKDRFYALGSYCGFDFTNLATGALLGEKLVCPTCMSSYDVKNGLVDIGPSMRNLSNFSVQTRDGQIKVTLPEHIPAFSKRKFLGRSKIDPRTFVVLGDSEAALSAMDALRMNFTGNIVCIPSSQYGQFENLEVFRRKFKPLTRNETFLTDLDFLDRANITVLKGDVKSIDKERKVIKIKGHKHEIEFDKMLVAWGAYKKRLSKDYTNAFYLEDRYAHAKCHNEILKAKKIVVLGSTLDTFDTASSIRGYLNSIGYDKTEVTVLSDGPTEVAKNMGDEVSKCITDMLQQSGVNVIDNAKITGIHGDFKIDAIHFRSKSKAPVEKDVKTGAFESAVGTDYFIKPDCVIVEDGVGQPKVDLRALIGHEESGDLNSLTFGNTNLPISNIRFSLYQNDIMSPILAAGSCTQYPSFMHKIKVRTDDIKYNIESGFFAAMNMLDKQVEFRYIPMTPLTIGDKKLYYVGEREQPITGVIFKGKLGGEKWVAFFTYGDEICGFLTCGYQNLHIYLLEAMKQLIMPSAAMLQAAGGNFDDIVNSVLKMRPEIEAGRQYTIQTPSVIRAEFTREIDALNKLRGKFKRNIRNEEAKAQDKLAKIKDKFDRDGVNYINDESQIGRPEQPQKPENPSNIGVNSQFEAAPPMLAKGHPSRFSGKVPQAGQMDMTGGPQNQGDMNPIKSVFRQANQMFTPDQNKR